MHHSMMLSEWNAVLEQRAAKSDGSCTSVSTFSDLAFQIDCMQAQRKLFDSNKANCSLSL